MNGTETFVRDSERRAITGVPTSTWYEMQDAGIVPMPVKIGPRSVAWLHSELTKWQADRIAERDCQAAI